MNLSTNRIFNYRRDIPAFQKRPDLNNPSNMVARKSEPKCLDLAASFACRLRRWRMARQIPLKQLAGDLGVSVSVVSAWEQGKRFPTLKHLEAVARHTGMSACRLLYPDHTDCPHCRQG